MENISMKHSKEQIENAIIKWSNYLLENKMATEDELSQVLSESWFKKAKGKVRAFFGKVGDAMKDAATAVHDIILANKGAKMMLKALDTLLKKKVNLANVELYASLGEDRFYPVLDFKVLDKKDVVLLVDPNVTSAPAKTVKEFREVLYKECQMKPKMPITDVVDSVQVGRLNAAATQKLNESIEDAWLILESKLTDYIEKNNLSKEDALKGDNFKALKKLIKQGDEKTKAAIERAFANKDGKSAPTKKPASKKPSKKSTKKTSSSKPTDAKSNDKFTNDKELEEEPKKEELKEEPPAYIIGDNKLLDVIPKQNTIGFRFGKSKEEIAIDYAFSL